jgi:nucleoside-diphosphate-sugar epimerase
MTAVLVTGAGGFIGRRVVTAVQTAGHHVTAIVRKNRESNASSVVRHDLRLPLGDLPPVDWIFHLAGAYAGDGDDELCRADFRMAENIIAWGLKARIKNWVLASAAEVYGDLQDAATEAAPTRPVIPYGRVKLAVERRFVESLKDVPGCRVVILRIGEVYGSEGRLMGELTTRLRQGFCPWPGTGRVRVSFVHVDDVAQVFFCAIQHAQTGISIYNVTDDVPVTWRDFTCGVAQRLGTCSPLFLPAPLVYSYAACTTLACRIWHQDPVLTRYALRLLMTPKVLSNARVKCELRFQPQYPSYTEGMEEALRGLSHDA